MAAKTVQERIALIDAKIAKKTEEIEALRLKKQRLLHPVTMKGLINQAKKAGLTLEEIAEKLEIEV